MQRGEESIGGRAKLFFAFSFCFPLALSFFSSSFPLPPIFFFLVVASFFFLFRARREGEGQKKGGLLWRDTYQRGHSAGGPGWPHLGPHGREAGMRGYGLREVRAATSAAAGWIGDWLERTHRWWWLVSSASLVRGSRSTRREGGREGEGGWLACGTAMPQSRMPRFQGLSRDRGARRGTCVGPAAGSVSEDVGRTGRAGGR